MRWLLLLALLPLASGQFVLDDPAGDTTLPFDHLDLLRMEVNGTKVTFTLAAESTLEHAVTVLFEEGDGRLVLKCFLGENMAGVAEWCYARDQRDPELPFVGITPERNGAIITLNLTIPAPIHVDSVSGVTGPANRSYVSNVDLPLGDEFGAAANFVINATGPDYVMPAPADSGEPEEAEAKESPAPLLAPLLLLLARKRA
ncbi:MAG: hypothetical protein ACPHK8_05360 [Thermoplasmatota archaeon]